MDDILLKYGMIIVAVVVIALLVLGGFKALQATELIPENEEQTFRGEADQTTVRIQKLCDKCLQRNSMDEDCYVLHVMLLSDSLEPTAFEPPYEMSTTLTKGENIIKIKTNNGLCQVVDFE